MFTATGLIPTVRKQLKSRANRVKTGRNWFRIWRIWNTASG